MLQQAARGSRVASIQMHSEAALHVPESPALVRFFAWQLSTDWMVVYPLE